jgi:hypothetical protein
MRARVRKSAAYSIPFLILCAILIWVAPPRTTPAAPAVRRADDSVEREPPRELPSAMPPTGGPYIDAESIRGEALSEAAGHGAVEPQAESVRFMTYGEAVDLNQTGWSPTVDFYREVYVVSVQGRVKAGHHVTFSFARSYYVYDASTGRLIMWGATDLPDPTTDGGGVGQAR